MPNLYNFYPPNDIMYSDVQWEDPGTQGPTNSAVVQNGNLVGRIININGNQLTFQDFMQRKTFIVTIGDAPPSQAPFSMVMSGWTGGHGRKSKKSKKSRKSRKAPRRSQRKVRR
jgi:hypothetical protein